MATHDELLTNSYAIRGRMMQFSVDIETAISIYIADHFTSDEDKIEEFICLILAPRMTLEQKFQVFRYLADKYNPEFKVSNKNYVKDIVHIIEQRNIFAHYPLEFSLISLALFDKEKSLSYVKLKNSSESGDHILIDRKYYKEEDVTKIISLMMHYISELNKLINK